MNIFKLLTRWWQRGCWCWWWMTGSESVVWEDHGAGRRRATSAANGSRRRGAGDGKGLQQVYLSRSCHTWRPCNSCRMSHDAHVTFASCRMMSHTPLPQIDIIGAMVIVWRLRRKLSGLFCAILCATIVHSAMHIYMNRPNGSLDWVLSHWAHFTVLRSIFVYVCILCLLAYIIYFRIATWWGGPGGIEAWSLGPLLPSVLWHCRLGHLTHKNRSQYDL